MSRSPPLPGFLTRRDLVVTWLRAAALGTVCLVVVFVAYEIAERAYFRDRVATQTLFLLHMARGITASVLVGTLSVVVVWWVRSRYDTAFAKAHRELEEAMEARIAEGKKLEAHLRNQDKMAALGLFSAGIAHDIANPLASLSSELEMLEGETDLARVRESMVELRRQVTRIDRALREMTDFARRRGDEAASVELHVAIGDALRMVRHDPRARKVHVEVDVASDLPPIRAVEDHMVMVLVNLLINAFDAMPEGGTLRISGRKEGEGATIVVSDTGVGMTAEVLEKATLPLFTTKGDRHGTGLGLAVSAGVVESAGGVLSLESTPGQGTRAKLHFPARRAGKAAVASEETP